MTRLTEKKFYPWLVVALLVVVSLMNYLDRQMIATMRPYMSEDIPALEDAGNFGRLMAVFLWIYALMSPVSGIIADRLNRKWLIVGSLFIWSAVTVAMGFTDSFNVLYALRALMGVSEAFYIPAALSLAADYHQGATRARAMGLLTSGVYLGQIFGGFGANVAAGAGWHHTFLIFGGAGILYSIILIVLLHERKTYSPDYTEKPSLAKELAGTIKGLGVLFTNIAFWVMLFYFAALNLPGWSTKNWLPTMMCDTMASLRGIPHQEAMTIAGPLATTSLALASFAGVFIGGWLSDRWVKKTLRGRIFTSATGLSMIIPALILISYGHSIPVLVCGAAIFGLGFGMYDTNNMPILCQFIPSRHRAAGYGFMNFVGIASGALITTSLGKAMESGHGNMIFAVMIAAVAVSVILQITVLKPDTLDKKENI